MQKTSLVAQTVKRLAYNVGDLGSIPGLGRYSGERNGNPLQYSCLENPLDGGAWQATVRGVAKSRTRLSNFTFTFNISGSRTWLYWKSKKYWRTRVKNLLIYFYLHIKVKVTQSCPTLCDPMDYTVHGFSSPEYWSG